MLNRDKSTKIRESDNMSVKAKPEFKLPIGRREVRNHDGAESRNILSHGKAVTLTTEPSNVPMRAAAKAIGMRER